MRLVRSVCVVGGSGVLAIAIALAGQPVPAMAQTRLEFRYPPVDVGTYTTVEECLAATDRVVEGRTGSYRAVTGIWTDTMPLDPRRAKWRPDTLQWTAARCVARFKEPTKLLAVYPVEWLMRLYLAADQDTVAAALLAQRLGIIPAKDSASRDTVEWAAINASLQAMPARFAMAEGIYSDRLRRATNPLARVRAHDDLAEMAYETLDTAKALTHLGQLIEDWERVPASQRVNRRGRPLPIAASALQRLHHVELMDSLRRGTQNYLAFQRVLWARALGPELAAKWPLQSDLVGKQAPSLTGDFWFGRNAAGRHAGDAVAAISSGKVGLVVFLNPLRRSEAAGEMGLYGCHPPPVQDDEWARRGGEGCSSQFAVLRRLIQRFPDLDVTLVTQTMGNFSTVAQPEAAKEAELIQHWLLQGQRLPATVVVQTTPFTRLKAPDRRAIYREVSNAISYRTTLDAVEPRSPWSGLGFLVDRDGLVVYRGEVERNTEPSYAELIELLAHRPRAGAGSAAAPPDR